MHRVHVIFTGEVQGVYFRHATMNFARDSGLTGWVRNLDDGRVEMVAEGEQKVLERLIEFLDHKYVIEEKEIRESTYEGKFPDFRIIR